MIYILDEQLSIVNQYMGEVRDARFADNGSRLEMNIERISNIAAYELSKHLEYKVLNLATLSGNEARANNIKQPVVIAAILRAGLPVQNGLFAMFEQAERAFVAAHRHGHAKSDGFDIAINYLVSPPLKDKLLIIADTIVATGNTVIKSYQSLLGSMGKPAETWVVSIVASRQAVQALRTMLPEVNLMIGSVDPELNKDFMIVPGLGDAGDRLYGQKGDDL